MDNPQHYQPLSAAITPSPYIPHTGRSPQQPHYSYPSHALQPATATAPPQRQEEEEEEEEDIEGELDPNHHDASAQSSPRPAGAHPPSASAANLYASQTLDQNNAQHPADDSTEKRKPGRPRGSRNRKPRAPAGTASTASKAPTNTQHPGFYSYPPAPGGQAAQNQQFYEFQWRALNLCSEFYNAAEELIKNAPPMVIAQCYQMGPVQKIDPLVLIAEAKRVCDNLLANPAQLVGTVPPQVYSAVPQYAQMPPPAPPTTSAASGSAATAASVITNPQSFVMPLSAAGHAGSYYPPVYAAPGQRYPGTMTTPYYPYAQGAPAYYPAQPQPQPQPQPQLQAHTQAQGQQQQQQQPAQGPSSAVASTSSTPVPAPTTSHAPPASVPASSSAPPSGQLSAFNAATGSIAAGGQQGTWSEEETERLRRLAEQSKEVNKGEIDWDWVIQQWGNSRTRHQILLKATSMGLKESTTRGTKRRRETDHAGSDSQAAAAAAGATNANVSSATTTPSIAPAVPPAHSQTQSPAVNHTSITTPPTQSHNALTNPGSSSSSSLPPSRSQTQSGTAGAASHAWPPPTVAAANVPSPVMVQSQIVDGTQQQRMTTGGNTAYYRRPSGAAAQAYGAPQAQPPPHSATTTTTSPTVQHSTRAGAAGQGSGQSQHQFMYRPDQGGARRENGYS